MKIVLAILHILAFIGQVLAAGVLIFGGFLLHQGSLIMWGVVWLIIIIPCYFNLFQVFKSGDF